jgi:hypothetical protein
MLHKASTFFVRAILFLSKAINEYKVIKKKRFMKIFQIRKTIKTEISAILLANKRLDLSNLSYRSCF